MTTDDDMRRMVIDGLARSKANRERALAVRDAMSLILLGVNDRRRTGASVDYRTVAASMLHRSISTQARYLGIDVDGWTR